MAGPGGDEVARVSVRVVPDTSEFGAKLRAELQKVAQSMEVRVPVRFDVDRAQFRAEVESLNPPTVHVPVEVDLPKPPPEVPVGADTTKAKAEVDKEVAEINAKKATVEVDVKFDKNLIKRRIETAELKAQLEIDQAKFLASVEAAKLAAERVSTVKAKVDVDRRSLSTVMSDLVQTVSNSGLGKAFSAISSAGNAAFNALEGSASSFLGSIRPGPALVLQIATALLTAYAYASVFALAGAAITAAWATVATAISAVPAAVALIGAPIAAVMLGMDGIKKAAQTLKPAFDQLKKSISDTFQRELTPVFQQLSKIMPTLQTGLTGTAKALSGVAKGFVDVVTSAEGTRQIEAIFRNVNAALTDMTPGIQSVTRALLTMASNSAAFGALVGFVNELGAGWERSVQKLSDTGVLTAAFEGLQGVLESLARAFVGLMENGVTAFSTMAPHIRTFVDSLTGFFGQFDWQQLGTAVGNVFSGIAEGIKAIPPSTIDAIQQAFVRLGEVFQSPVVQQFIVTLANLLPGVINDTADFVAGLAAVGTAIGTVFTFLDQATKGEFKSGIWFLDASLPELASAAWDGVKSVLSSAWSSISSLAASAWTSITSAVSTAWNAIGTFISGAAQAVLTTLQAWATNVGTFFATAWASITAGVSAAWTAIGTAISTALAFVTTLITTWATNVATFFATAWAGLTTAVQTAWAMITTVISTALALIITTLVTWGTTLLTTLQTVWTTVTTAVQTAWTLITTVITTATTTVLTALTTWGQSILTTLATAWAAVQAAVLAAWTAVTATISTAVQTVLTTVQAWGQQLVAFLQQTWTNVQTAVQTAWNTLVQTVQTGIQQVLQFFQQLPGQIVSALSSLPGQLASIGQNAINSLVNAIRAGASAVVSAIVSVVTSAIAAAKSALGIGSPSKVFRGFGSDTWAGYIRGSDGMRTQVLDSIRAITNDVLAAGRQTADAFDLPQEFTGGAAALESRIIASAQPLVSGALGLAEQAAGMVINNNVYNPIAEKASDSIQRKLRTLSALGLLGAPDSALGVPA